jgi:hypothetical protein
MQQDLKTRIVAWAWWLAPVLLLMVLGLPLLRLLGPGFLRLLIAGAAVIWVAAWAARRGLLPGWERPRDAFSDEEQDRRERLAALQHEVEQMEITLRDLRALRLVPSDATRAQWAEVDLEEALGRAREAVVRERAALSLLETLRWLTHLEPLVRQFDRLDEGSIRRWLDRFTAIRSQGVEILVRIRGDVEALKEPAGQSAVKLLEEALAELHALRADLLTRRAELLAQHPLQGSDPLGLEHPALERLRDLLHHARARREVNSWLSEG